MHNHFTQKYSIAKILRFALLPQDETLEYINKNGLLEQDAQRASDYIRAKKIIDEFHKSFIERVLETLTLPINLLHEFEAIYLKDNISKTEADKKNFIVIQDALRKHISDGFTKHAEYKRLFGKELIKEDVISWLEEELRSAQENNAQENNVKVKDSVIFDLNTDIAIIKSFDKFTTYFSGFHENRRNIYTAEAHSTAIGYRIIHENLPKFIQNKQNYNFLQRNENKYPNIIHHLKNAEIFKAIENGKNINYNNLLEGADPESILDLAHFNATLTQNGIDQYNQAIGGVSLQDGTKIKGYEGLNQVINHYRQGLNKQHKKGEKPVRLAGFNMLYKQILSDREHFSFRLGMIENDEALTQSIQNFYHHYLGAVQPAQGTDSAHPFSGLLARLPKILDDLNQADTTKIWVRNDTNLTGISQKIFGSYSLISEALDAYYEDTNPDFIEAKAKAQAKSQAKAQSKKQGTNAIHEMPKKMIDAKNQWLKSGYFNLETLNKALNHFKTTIDVSTDDKKALHELITDNLLIHYFLNPQIKVEQAEGSDLPKQSEPLLSYVEACYQEITSILEVNPDSLNTLRQDKAKVAGIKKFLDSVQALFWHIQPLYVKEIKNQDGKLQVETYEQDPFYEQFTLAYDALGKITALYNQVRNYLTQKPYSIDKYKLNFENATLLAGWDANKETDNTSVILRKKARRHSLEKDNTGKIHRNLLKEKHTGEEYYAYYLAIMPQKYKKAFVNLPLVKAGETHYEKLHYKLLPGANKMLPKVFFSTKGVAAFKPSERILDIYKNECFKKGATFDLTALHELIDFYKYSISIHPDWKEFNHQFSPTHTFADISGFYREVEHQGYKINFEQKISESHINHLVAEGKLYLFQIYNKDFSAYSKGNKNLHTLYWEALFDEKNIENVIYKLNGEAEVFYRKASLKENIEHPQNLPIARKSNHLTKNNPNENKTSVFPYDLIKDKRFTQDSFQFHVPITLNFKATGLGNINEDVFNYIRDQKLNNKPMNIIGLDRGERHLIYLSVIDPTGKILHQKTLNTYNEIDYQQKLDLAEDERDKARKAWLNIENIKELKAGYLSLVVHDIATLMLEHNAIIAMEDLNFGFKRGRIKIEKQVYQKFEKALIDKLNYLVFKKPNAIQPGLMNALQLANKFESFQKLGRQSGFIFYVPAAYTSKIDPTTGFVNFLDTRYYSADKARLFLSQFEFIRFNSNNLNNLNNQEEGYFEFGLDYAKFTDRAATTREDWTLCTHGTERHIYSKSNQLYTTFNVTQSLTELFEEYGIDYQSCDLKESILGMTDAPFFQQLLYCLNVLLKMRYDDKTGAERNRDYVLSPVKNSQGEFYDSRVHYDQKIQGKAATAPLDADANGAYNIALKGLMMLEKIQNTDGSPKLTKLAMKDKEWLVYAQNRMK